MMKLIDFFEIVGKLKTIRRTGWAKNNVPNPESVAEHSFRFAVMAMVLAPKIGANVEKAIKMALIHDIGKARTGDLIIMQGKQKLANYLEKLNLEGNAFKETLSLIDGDEYTSLFNEFVGNKTKEAKFVNELDKLEMAMQAYEYEKKYKINLETFFENSKALISSKKIKELLEKIEKLR
jgi:putative hydrolases of HD superfamily